VTRDSSFVARVRAAVWLASLVFTFAAAVPAARGAGLPAAVEQVLERQGIPASSLGVFVQAVDGEAPLLAFDADQPRNPASVIKVLTSFAALELLGPAYTWRTNAYADGPLREGRLAGDLVVEGRGDPFLVTERLWKLLFGLRLLGLREIGGDLVIDRSYFSLPPEDPGDFDGRPYRAYNVIPDALLVNFGAMDFWFLPDAEAGRVLVASDPPSARLRIDNRIALTPGNCASGLRELRMEVLEREAGGLVRFSGPYPGGCGPYVLTRAVSSPLALAGGVFEALWSGLGGSLAGTVRDGRKPAGAKPLHSLESPPLVDLIRATNKWSNNVMSRQLLLTLGAERYGPPGTLEKGRRAVDEWLAGRGLEMPGLVLDNGSGLSRDARASARSLGRLLLAAYRSPYMPELVSSLPLSGIDGTLRRRFRDEPLAGRAHIKTGTLDDVRAMGGYLQARSGRRFVVVSLQNYPGVQYGRGTEVQNALLRWLFEQ